MFSWSIILIATNKHNNTEQKERFNIQKGFGSPLFFPSFWLQDFYNTIRGIPGFLQKFSSSSLGTDTFIFLEKIIFVSLPI